MLLASTAVALSYIAAPAYASNTITSPTINASASIEIAHHSKGQKVSNNILLQDWDGPFEGVPAWDKVKISDFPTAFEEIMKRGKADFETMFANPEPISFENTIIVSELQGEYINRLFSYWGVHSSNLSSPKLRKIQGEWLPRISAFFNQIALDARYFQRIQYLYDQRQSLNLDAKQTRLLERTYENLVSGGALLTGDNKSKLIDVSTQLSRKFSEFSNKVLADEETYTYLVDKSQVEGLSESFLASIRAPAVAQNKRGWALKNTRSVMQPFLENATNREARKKVYNAYINRGDNGDDNDTNAIIADILKLRQERAELLGYKTHAHFRMTNTMAQDPENAMDLMMKVWPAAVERVRQEVADMQAIADAENANITIEPWDYRFYAEKVRKAKYDLDQAEIKPYFQLDNMIAAMFDAAGRLYDLDFKENTGDVPVFHPDVRTFIVTDKRDGSNVGLFYMDNYARQGKRSGAWATTYRSQQSLGGERNVLASNNNNFVKPAEGEKALISIDDASTLFHEFGHALHSLLTDVTYPGLRGTPRDFVEYPSQVNENWLLTPYVLNTYAKHAETGEAIPQSLVDKIEASSKFNEGFATVEYLSSAIVDMKLHFRNTPVTDVDKFERETLAEIGMPKEIVMRHRLPQFNHLFSSDAYSAGYYSYLWSETMDADTWAAFEEAGSEWDKATADKFRKVILSTGNETDRIEAYRAFRGRDPDVKFILKKRGFPVPGETAGDTVTSEDISAGN